MPLQALSVLCSIIAFGDNDSAQDFQSAPPTYVLGSLRGCKAYSFGASRRLTIPPGIGRGMDIRPNVCENR